MGTPFYCYSSATILRHYHVFADAFAKIKPLICYAVKANSNLAVLATLAQAGAGADIVTMGELKRALKAGISPKKIVFSGVGKTKEELTFALESGIYQINVESYPELCALEEVAIKIGKTAPVALRVNPDVDAKTHAKISTGRAENKFGIPLHDIDRYIQKISSSSALKWQGVAVHIGSQLTDLAPYREAFSQLATRIKTWAQKGIVLETIDLGGGLGIPYQGETPPLPTEYAQMISEVFHDFQGRFILEPGRMIVGNAGILVTKVIYVKEAAAKNFLIVDGAMNDLLRPSLYEAYHEVIPVKSSSQTFDKQVDIVGPVCETGDYFAQNRGHFPYVEPGDMVAIRSAGAYGAVMSSTYNSRPLIPEVMVHGDQFAVIRPRQTYETLLSLDLQPEWLQNK